MKNKIIACIAVLSLSSQVGASNELAQNKKQSMAAVKEFAGKLKGEMKRAMKAGGPVNAIKVCRVKAPEIALAVSNKHKLNIARTSLKVRNPGNQPDAWELKVLKQFEARKAKGESVKKMAYSEVVNMDGKKVFRFMKAIPTGKVCLNCHAAKIKPEVEARLKTLYPADQARGFKLGDIRGSFTVMKTLP
jgi:hypothetical protein